MSAFLAELDLPPEDLIISPQDLERMIGNMQCNRDWYTRYLRREQPEKRPEISAKFRIKNFFKKFEKRY